MLITILLVALAWTAFGGALAINDCNEYIDRRPDWFWLVVYGPALWLVFAFIGFQYGAYLLTRYIERKLRK